jgi:hypothetical protein
MCAKCLGKGFVEEEREEEGMLVVGVVPCSCPAADNWVDEWLGYELAWDRHANAA